MFREVITARLPGWTQPCLYRNWNLNNHFWRPMWLVEGQPVAHQEITPTHSWQKKRLIIVKFHIMIRLNKWYTLNTLGLAWDKDADRHMRLYWWLKATQDIMRRRHQETFILKKEQKKKIFLCSPVRLRLLCSDRLVLVVTSALRSSEDVYC